MGMAVTKQEAFWEACGFGHVEKARALLSDGIDVNWVSYTHNSCAIHVASQGKPEIVRMLLDANCNIHAVDDRGNIALHHAAMKGHADIMQTLIDAGSDVNTQDKNGWTPLFNAAYWCQPGAIDVLVKSNCDANLKNKDDRTALHEACRSPNRDDEGLGKCAQLLLGAGCDMNLKGSDIGMVDFTPLMFAAYHGHPQIVKALIDAKCDLNAQASNNWSALHWATDRGRHDIVRMLLDSGIDPLLRGMRGELALQRAHDNEIRDILAEVTGDAEIISSSLEDAGEISISKVDTRKKVSEMLSNGTTPFKSVRRKRTHPSEVALFAPQVPSSSTIPIEDSDLANTPSIFDAGIDFIDGEDDDDSPINTPSDETATSVSEKDQKEALEKNLAELDVNDDYEIPDDDGLDPEHRDIDTMAMPPTAGVEDYRLVDTDDEVSREEAGKVEGQRSGENVDSSPACAQAVMINYRDDDQREKEDSPENLEKDDSAGTGKNNDESATAELADANISCPSVEVSRAGNVD